MNEDHQLALNTKSLRQVISTLSASLTVPFYGEPLSGIQIMGMLETRTLDFDNVIILSCNEDILPKGKSLNTFIPVDVRREFNLPSYTENNAVIAYHFYRLLQRASNIWLLYNSEPGILNGGEESRFIKQLIYELPKYNPQLAIRQQVLSYAIDNPPIHKEIVIDKNPTIIDNLKLIAARGFSPTSLSAYLDCPLRFYFSQVLHIEESEESDELLDASMLGQAVHAVLKHLYEPFISQKKVDPEALGESMSKIDSLLDVKLRESYDPILLSTGQNVLSVRIAEKMIRNILKQDRLYMTELANQGLSIRIIDLEKPLKKNLTIDISDNEKLDVIIKGTLDRIDSIGNLIRILDYKTGKVESKELKLNSVEDIHTIDNPAKAFQLLTYSWLFHDSEIQVQPGLNLACGILAAKKVSGFFLPLLVNDQQFIKAETIEATGTLLSDLITEIFDPELPFIQTDNAAKCKYCPYAGICER